MPILTANSGTYYPSPRHRAAADLAPLSITSPRAALVRLPPTTIANAKSVVSPTSAQSAAAAAHFVGRLSPRTQRSAQRLQGSVVAPALPYEYDRRKRRASLPPSDNGHSPTTSAVLLPKLNNVAINKVSNQQTNAAAAAAPSVVANAVAVHDTPPTTSVRQHETNPHSQQHLSTHRPQHSADHSRKASTSLTPLITSNTIATNAPSSSSSSTTTTSSTHNRQLSRCTCATPHSPLPRLSSYTHTHINGHSCQVYAHLTNPLHRILFIAFFTADILHTQPHRLLINVPRSLLCDKLKRDHVIRELTKHLYFTINDNYNQCELHLDITNIVHNNNYNNNNNNNNNNILYNNTPHNGHDGLTTTSITSVSSPTAAATTKRHPTPVDTATLSTYIHRYIIQPSLLLDDTLTDLTHIALTSETIDELNQRSQHSRSVSSSITHQNQQHHEHNSAPPSKHPSAMLSSPSVLPAQYLLSPTSSSAELTIMTLSLSPRSSINLMSPSSSATAITSLDEVKLHDSIADDNVLTSNRPSVQVINNNNNNNSDNITKSISPPSQETLTTTSSLPIHPVSLPTNNDQLEKTTDKASAISNDDKTAAVDSQNHRSKSNTELTVNTDELQQHYPADTTTNVLLSPAESTLLISPSDTAISLVSDSSTMSPQSDSSTDKSDSNLDDDVDDDDDNGEQNGEHQRMLFPIIAIDKVDLPNDSPTNNDNNSGDKININGNFNLSTMKLLKPSIDNTPNTSKPVSARTGNKLLDLFLPPDEDEINSLESNDNAISVPSSARIPLLTTPYALSATTSAVSSSSLSVLSSINLPSARPYNISTTFDLSALTNTTTTNNNNDKLTNNTTTTTTNNNTNNNNNNNNNGHNSIPTSLSSVYCGYHDSAGIYGDENIEYDDEIEMKRAALEGLYNYSDTETDDNDENRIKKHDDDDDGLVDHHDNE